MKEFSINWEKPSKKSDKKQPPPKDHERAKELLLSVAA